MADVNHTNIEFTIKNGIVNLKSTEEGISKSKCFALSDFCNVAASMASSYKTVVPMGCRAFAETKSSKYLLFITPAFVGRCECEWPQNIERDFGSYTELKEGSSTRLDGSSRNSRVFTIPYPPTAMIASIKETKHGEYRLSGMWCYALQSSMFSLNKLDVYKWPYTNVYGNNTCCLGLDGDWTSPTMDGLAAIPRLVYNGVCNTDLSGHNVLDIDGKYGRISEAYELITKLHDAGAKEFPYEYLKPLDMTVAETFAAISGVNL